MNWFSVTMYARARKKGMTAAGKFAPTVAPAQTGEKKHVTRTLHTKDRTIRLTIDPAKEIA